MATAAPKTAAKRTVKPAAKKTEDAAFANADAFKTAEEFTAKAREQFEDTMSYFADAAEDMREKTEDVTAEMRARFEKQQKIAADINTDMVEAAKSEVSDAVQFANDLGKAKTFADMLEIQQAYVANLFETRVARAQDMTAKSVEATKEAFTPMTTDFGAFFDTSAYEKMFRFPAKL
jgi:hypothetical protein